MVVVTEFMFPSRAPSDKDRGMINARPGKSERAAMAKAVEYKEEVGDSAGMQTAASAALDQGPVWPVFLASPAFLYLWWLAILLFDLTFVWHLYIRWSEGEKYIRRRIPRTVQPTDRPRV